MHILMVILQKIATFYLFQLLNIVRSPKRHMMNEVRSYQQYLR